MGKVTTIGLDLAKHIFRRRRCDALRGGQRHPLCHPVKGSDLKSWALAARRAGMRKAKVALARKLAVVLHRMLRDETVFVAHRS